MQRSDNDPDRRRPRGRTAACVALAVVLGFALLAVALVLKRYPKGTLAAFFKNPLQSVKSSAGFLVSTAGYDGRWHTRDPDDPAVMMDVRFSMNACEVDELLPAGGVKHARFADGRNPPRS